MIDTTTGTAAIAYAGQTPWHGLGQRLDQTASIETWQKAAGLDYEVLRAPVTYDVDGETKSFNGRSVLYRSDTHGALGLVGKNYQIVQPSEVLHFFDDLVESAGFHLEVAGGLKEGKRIWALAKLGEGAEVRKGDEVLPYLLLSTSYDGTMATTAQFTAIRVVCNNTISAADRETGTPRVAVWHNSTFNADHVKAQLGLLAGSFDTMMTGFQDLARKRVTDKKLDAFLAALLVTGRATERQDADVIRKSTTYRDIIELFEGKAIGHDLPGVKGTAWGLLNSVTEFIDHHAGRSADGRLDAAWFGKGGRVKAKAMELALAL
jgi:phage/plasmid-like protein (TIGR03299 family)